MALSTYLSDDCTGTSGTSIAGRTFNNANGGSASDTFTVDAGTINIQSNTFQDTGDGTLAHCRPTSMSAVAEIQVSCKTSRTGTDHGPLVRYVDVNNHYLFNVNGAGTTQVFDKNGGSYTQLGSNGPTSVSAGQTLAFYAPASGYALVAYVNGASEISATDTNAHHATGVGGWMLRSDTTIDDLKIEVTAGGGGATTAHPKVNATLADGSVLLGGLVR